MDQNPHTFPDIGTVWNLRNDISGSLWYGALHVLLNA